MRTIGIVVSGLLIAVLVTACGGTSKHVLTTPTTTQPTSHTITGRISMICGSTSSVLIANGSLTLTDQSGTLLGTGTASENIPAMDAAPRPTGMPASENPCFFDFSVPNVPDTANFYTVTTALGKTSFSHAHMVASHWRADVTITSPS